MNPTDHKGSPKVVLIFVLAISVIAIAGLTLHSRRITMTADNSAAVANTKAGPVVTQPVSQKMFFMGGLGTNPANGRNRIVNDVWQSSDGNNWVNMSPNGAASTTKWSPRRDIGGVYFQNKIWAITGDDTANTAGIWNSADGVTWTRVNPVGTVWVPRVEAGVTVFDNKIWVLGGFNAASGQLALAGVWNSADGINWTHVDADPTIAGIQDDQFTKVREPSLVVYNNNLWKIGGVSSIIDPNEIRRTADGVTWTQVTAPTDWISSGSNSAVVNGGVLYIMGFDNAGGPGQQAVWSTSNNGTTWTKVMQSGTGTWPIRTNHVLVSMNNKMYIMTGCATEATSQNDQPLDDIWMSSNGSNWSVVNQTLPFGGLRCFGSGVVTPISFGMPMVPTGQAAPQVTTVTSTGVQQNSVTIQGNIAGNAPVNRWIEYAGGSSTAKVFQKFNGSFTETIYGLQGNSGYQYRACAENSAGISCGAMMTFTTTGTRNSLSIMKAPAFPDPTTYSPSAGNVKIGSFRIANATSASVKLTNIQTGISSGGAGMYTITNFKVKVDNTQVGVTMPVVNLGQPNGVATNITLMPNAVVTVDLFANIQFPVNNYITTNIWVNAVNLSNNQVLCQAGGSTIPYNLGCSGSAQTGQQIRIQ